MTGCAPLAGRTRVGVRGTPRSLNLARSNVTPASRRL